MKTFKTILGSAALLLVSKCDRKGRRSCRVTSSRGVLLRRGHTSEPGSRRPSVPIRVLYRQPYGGVEGIDLRDGSAIL